MLVHVDLAASEMCLVCKLSVHCLFIVCQLAVVCELSVKSKLILCYEFSVKFLFTVCYSLSVLAVVSQEWFVDGLLIAKKRFKLNFLGWAA